MRVYLDDLRRPPVGWHLVKTADECGDALVRGRVDELSLDHDLAEEHYPGARAADGTSNVEPRYREKTGLAVVEWMVAQGPGFSWPKLVIVHTMNPVGRANMLALLRRAPPEVRVEVRIGFRG